LVHFIQLQIAQFFLYQVHSFIKLKAIPICLQIICISFSNSLADLNELIEILNPRLRIYLEFKIYLLDQKIERIGFIPSFDY